jgi:hypothetical protein
MTYIEVPAYVQEEAIRTVNHVQVQGGTNWDLSRTAATTPLSPAPDPEPVRIPDELITPAAYKPADAAAPCAHKPVVVKARKALKPRTSTKQYRTSGKADSQEQAPRAHAEKRATVVAKELSRKEHKAGATAHDTCPEVERNPAE